MKKILGLLGIAVLMLMLAIPSPAQAIKSYTQDHTYNCYVDLEPTAVIGFDGTWWSRITERPTTSQYCDQNLRAWQNLQGYRYVNFCAYSYVNTGPSNGGLRLTLPNGWNWKLEYSGTNANVRCTGTIYVGGIYGWVQASVDNYGPWGRQDYVKWFEISPVWP